MPANDMNIGRDLAFVVVGPNGLVEIPQVTSYSATRNSTDLASKGIDGTTRHANLPDSYTIVISYDRTNSAIDDLFALIDADYYAGVNIKGGTIYETVQNTNGSVSQYRYEDVVLKYDGGGEYKGDSFVSSKITCMATRKIKVS